MRENLTIKKVSLFLVITMISTIFLLSKGGLLKNEDKK